MLIDAIPENLHKLLKNGGLAAIAFLRKLCRVVVVTVDRSFVLIIRVLCAEDGRADATGEVLDVILAVQGGDVGTSQRSSTCKAEEVEPAKVVGFAQRVLIRRSVGNGKKLGSYNLIAILEEIGVS